MSNINNSPSADRDIDFCQKAIEAGFIVPAIVPTVLRKLNEKQLKGQTTSIGQELIHLGLMTPQQVKEVLMTLDNVDLICASCKKKYKIRAYDPGKQYACKECGSLLEPIILDQDDNVQDDIIEEESQLHNIDYKDDSSSLGRPYPDLAKLVASKPSETSDNIHSDLDKTPKDPIIESARKKLREKGIVGKNVLSIPDDMLEEVIKSQHDHDTDIIEEDYLPKQIKPSSKKTSESSFKDIILKTEPPKDIAAVKPINQIKSKERIAKSADSHKVIDIQPVPEVESPTSSDKSKRRIEKGSLVNKFENRSQPSVVPEKIETEDTKETEETPEPKKSSPLSASKSPATKPSSETSDKYEKIKIETKRKGPAIIFIILILSLLANAGLGYLFWTTNTKLSDASAKLTDLQIELQNKEALLNVYANKELNILSEQASKEYREAQAKKLAQYYENQSVKQALIIALELEGFIIHLPESVLASAELYQNAGEFDKSVELLENMIKENSISDELKLEIALKLTEFYTFDLNNYNLNTAQLKLNYARQLVKGNVEIAEVIRIWDNLIKDKKQVPTNLNVMNSYYEAIIYLLNNFVDLVPSFATGKGKHTISEYLSDDLSSAIKEHNKTYSLAVLEMLLIINSTAEENLIYRTLRNFEARFGNTFWTQNLLSNIYFKQQNYSETEKTTTWILTKKGNLSDNAKREDTLYKESIQLRAQVKMNLDKWEDAVQDWTSALWLMPANTTEILKNRGIAYLKVGKFDNALTDFNESLKRNPQYSVKKLQVNALIELERYELAERRINELKREITTKDSELHLLSGKIFMRKGETDIALEEFNQALQLNPKLLEAHFFKAMIYVDLDDITKLNEAKNELQKLDSESWQFCFLQGIIAKKEGRKTKSNSFFTKALTLAPPANSKMIKEYLE